MKNKPTHPLSVLWLALALVLGPALRAQEAPPPKIPEPVESIAPPAGDKPAPIAAPDAPEAPAAASPAAAVPAVPAAPVAEEPEAKAAEGELRELGEEPSAASTEQASKPKSKSHVVRLDTKHEGPPLGNHLVPAGVTESAAVSILGSSTVDGRVTDGAVSVFGNTTVNGEVDGEAVSVFGTTTINGTVGGETVAVFGDVILGPKAVTKGEAVAILGKVVRAEGAQALGGIQEVGNFGPFGNMTWLRSYVTKCLIWGRPLWVGEGLGWAWLVAGAFLVLYMLIALLFPSGIIKSVEVLEQRPGATFLAALLTMLLTPILIVLLCITVVGIALVPFLGVGLFFATFFGKAAVFAWLGRRVVGTNREGISGQPWVAVLVGGLLVAVLYMIPIMGFLLWKFFAVLGLGMVVYRLILSMQREKPVQAVAAATGGGAPPVMPGEAVPGATVLPAVISASTLERAGFWHRIAAALLDVVMVGIVFGMLHRILDQFGGAFPLWFAIYNVAMWATKGTTIGGIVCGLKLVRLDDRPVDWGVAIVRGLSAFLSLAVAGLGFIWVAFDNEKQSWHDKIAGTTIVRVPKGTPLL